MKVFVKKPDGKTIKLAFPSELVFNSLFATIACSSANRAIEEHSDCNVKLTPKQMRTLFKALNEASNQLKKDGLPFVEVISDDGDNITVML